MNQKQAATIEDLRREHAALARVIADCKSEVEALEAEAQDEDREPDLTAIGQANRRRRDAAMQLQAVERALATARREARASSWAAYADAFIRAAKRRLSQDVFADLDEEARAASGR